MVLFLILGVVVAITFIVLGVLFFMLGKEAQKEKEEEKAVPVGLDQFKKELSSQMFEQQGNKAVETDSGIVPIFVPQAPVDPISAPQQSPLQAQSAAKPSSSENEIYKKRVKELEDELLAISRKADGQSTEARQIIEALTKENELLKSQQTDLEQAKQRVTEWQGEASGLKTENAGLQARLESADARARLLEEEMAAVKIQMGEEINRAQATIDELNREKEALSSAPKAEADSDESLRHEWEALRIEHIQLKQKYEALQYELIKARAQSSGLERVSFNYKNQLEDFFKKINAVQMTNDHLTQVKNRLEGMVEEIKLQNEELVKKDQLAKFELEKNRSRLASLEREYEDFKARAQQKNR